MARLPPVRGRLVADAPIGPLTWFRVGGPAEVLFRPEDVTLAADTPHLNGTVAAAFFLGDRTRLFVQVGEGRPIMVETSTRRDFQHGEAVGLNVDPRGLMAL
jgi:putative spermidine/putrescine transport system ATP-binding protein